MLAHIIDGEAIAADIRKTIAAAVTALKRQHNLIPTLAAVLVGDDPASQVYVRAKTRQAREAGLNTIQHLLPTMTSEAGLLDLVASLNSDDSISAILVQLPLPEHIKKEKILSAMDPAKDVDGFHPINVGRLWVGAKGIVPCTPHGCMIMLDRTLGKLAGKRALVIGRSNIVGKPLAALLLREDATVTIAHSKTEDLPRRCREADILVAAVGSAGMVRGDWIKPGATVIDVGISRVAAPEKGFNRNGTPKTRIVGDVAFDEARMVAGWITPVPGGVGPMTIACLMRNTVIAACRRRGLADPEL
jgi:methylenetetrahydrofolate dehydrogenase (NADP+) / methenyltetrahydrofolate cyclohydrolase